MSNFDDWKTTRYSTKGGMSGELLTDPLKAFGCLRHVLLTSKLRAYGIELSSLRLFYSYLVRQKQNVWLKNSYNTWSEFLFGFPQGSTYGSLLFSCNLLSFVSIFYIASNADDNTSYRTGQSTKEVINYLEKTSGTSLALFKNNRMKANPDKYHILVNSKDQTYLIKVGNKIITKIQCEDLLGIKIYIELNFDSMSNHCVNLKNKHIIKSDIYYELWTKTVNHEWICFISFFIFSGCLDVP